MLRSLHKGHWFFPLVALVALGLLVAGGFTVYRLEFPQLSPHSELASIAQAFVRQEIAEEVQVTFSPDEETAVNPAGDHKYLVQGWVDLIRAEGEVERQTFSCVIYKDTWGDWAGEDITLMAQM